ncbi:copper-binding protein [Pseudomonas gingeri]|uniref:copper-binding protein n=1 Tax=Pseudomonas gingeri TaxID=117681 RepID=UPI0015A2A052|nr:copper-binding protein [Pseudomonas gingeri]NWD06293.1 copper-binding protein [Pseudomonas gingeri]NWD49336.1 copper-binding protein [Pseudomonas gingeri]NWE32869.1 copper-binding protein [Pseudomonas gingeri]NWE60481.1 copper-binding protein [Pseudomonas gingeri]NWF04945.1 copper-binding protein [Pseudomonas gingeri]
MKRILITVVTTMAVLSFNAYAEEMNMGGESMQTMTRNRAPNQVSAAKADGVIKAIDAEKHTVTIAHGAIASIRWPAMTMAFSVTPEQLMGLRKDDHVAFAFGLSGSVATIESIEKMK